MALDYEWRGGCTDTELNQLHAEAFETRIFDDGGWSWTDLLDRHSLGWVVARDGDDLVGFVNVVWDGRAHAWLQDTMVATKARRGGIGTRLVALARDGASGPAAAGSTLTTASISHTSTKTTAASPPPAPD